MESVLTTRQLAKALGVSRETVAYRVRRGYLAPVIQLPAGDFLFSPDVVEEQRKRTRKRKAAE